MHTCELFNVQVGEIPSKRGIISYILEIIIEFTIDKGGNLVVRNREIS